MNQRRTQSAAPSKQTATIPLSDLKRIQDQFTIYKLDLPEKFELHQKSQARVKNWPNTLKSNKVQKDKSQFERFKKDEEQRRLIDQEEAAYQASVKREILGKANKQLFENQDRMRGFQSKLLVVDALQEREAQKEIKLMQNQMELQREQMHHEQLMDAMAQNEMIETRKQEQLKIKKQNQQDMLKQQHQLMKDKFVRGVQEEKIEGELIKAKALADLQKEVEEAQKRKQKVHENQQMMIIGNEVIKKQKEQLKQKEIEEDAKIEEYARRQERRNEIRKMKSDQIMLAKQMEKQKLIDAQAKVMARRVEEQNKLLNKNIVEAEIKAEDVERRKKEQRKKLQSAIDYSRRVKGEITKEITDNQIQQNQHFQQYWINRNKELEEQELAEKQQLRKRQQGLAEYHKAQQDDRMKRHMDELMNEYKDVEQTKSKQENDQKQFELWAQKQIEKYKAEGKSTTLLMKELNLLKNK